MVESKDVTVIVPKNKWFDLNIKELVRYRDLIFLFVRRTFVSQYKQTILGPAWAVIQPFFTTIIFTVVFGNIAQLSTDGVPQFVFYMCGTVPWLYFSGCLTMTATTFTTNSQILGKVYFPRLVMPISTVLNQLISFAIQFAMFFVFWLFYFLNPNCVFRPTFYLFLVPVLILEEACLGLGFGIIVSALTTKYRDLAMLVSFGVQLWMYATPIAYTTSTVPDKYLNIYMLNPMTPIIETFRYAFFGSGEIHVQYLLISFIVAACVLFIGVLLFNRVEKTFMDTV